MTLPDVLHDDPVALSPGPLPRDGFAQMLATLDAQLDHDLGAWGGSAGPAAGDPEPAAAAPPVPRPQAPLPRPAPVPRVQPASRSMMAPAVAVVVTVGVVGCAAILIAMHWRPTRSMAAGMPVASALSTPVPAAPSLPAPTPAPAQTTAAVPGPLARATRLDQTPPANATAAASSCTSAQTALGLCKTLTNPTTTLESSP